MSERDPASRPAKRAVALHYGESDTAPVIVASGMGYLAEKIVETAAADLSREGRDSWKIF